MNESGIMKSLEAKGASIAASGILTTVEASIPASSSFDSPCANYGNTGCIPR